MKRTMFMAGLMILFLTSLQAQNRNARSEQKATTNKETNKNNTHQADAGDPQNKSQQENESVAKGNKADHKGTADTPGAEEAAASANNNPDSQQTESNTPAVSQTTSSASGSPGVLSGKNGEQRDGTNNVQRATMNMAGSPVANLRLDDTKTVDANTEMRDRQDHSQEKQVSAQNSKQSSSATSGQSGQINNNSRRENNAASDQNLSSKDNNAGNTGKSGTGRRKKG